MKSPSFKHLLFALAVSSAGLFAQSPFLDVVGPNFAIQNQNRSVVITGFDLFGTTGTPQVCYNPAGATGVCTIPLTGVSGTANRLTATFPAQATTSNGSISVRPNFGSGPVSSINSLSFAVIAAGDIPSPSISGLSQSSLVVGSADLSLTINGSGFAPPLDVGTSAYFLVPGNGSGTLLNTSTITDTSLGVTLPAGNVAPGTYFIYVVVGGRFSNLFTFTVVSPSITSISPGGAIVNTGPVTLTLNGSFPTPGTNAAASQGVVFQKPDSTLTAPTIQSQSSTQIVVTVPNTSLDILGSASVFYRVVTGRATTTDSNSATFAILPPPTLTAINPNSAVAGAVDTQITLTGTGFTNGGTPRVTWGFGQVSFQLAVTATSATSITATVSASLLTVPGTAQIRVISGSSGSNLLPFTINPAPDLQFITPNKNFAGASQFVLSLSGANFTSGGTPTVRWTPAVGSPVNLTIGSATDTLIQLNVPAGLIANAGTATLNVIKGGVFSSPQTFTILPSPVISSLSPTAVPPGNPDFVLTITGQNLAQPGYSAQVNFGGTALFPTSATATQIQVTVPAALVTTSRQVPVTVELFELIFLNAQGVKAPRPAASSFRLLPQVGPVSNTLTFSVLGPLTLTTLNPTFIQAGSPNTQLTLTGTNFDAGSVVRFDGTNLTTVFNSTTQLTATIPSNLITAAGTPDITVRDSFNRTSNTIILPILASIQISSLSPTFREAGSGSFTLTINGSGFEQSSVARFSGVDLITTFVSASQLTATVPGNLIAAVGTAPVTVRDARGRSSNSVNFTIVTALQLTSINPVRGNAGVPAFTLVVNGQGFTNGSVVRFNNANLTTTFVSSTVLTAQVPPIVMLSPGVVDVRVQVPDGRLSSTLPFTILPQLLITTLNPPVAPPGGNSVNLLVTGQGFTTESVVRFGGLNLSTTFVSDTQLRAIISDSLLTGSTAFNDVTVANPLNAVSNAIAFGGGGSGSLTITSLNPNSAPVNSPATPMVVTGSGFTSSTVIRFGNIDIPTTFSGPTQLQATIPAQLLTSPGKVPVVASNGGVVSNTLTFEVGNRPEITFLNPNSITAGAPRFTLIVLGANFVSGATIKFGSDDLPTTFASSSQLSAPVPADLLTTARNVSVTVTNPDGQTSNAQTFRIVNLTLTSIDPTRAAVNAAPFTLSLTGTGFIQGATVSFGGTSLITTFGSSTGLTAAVPTSALATPGQILVSVSNPDGARSNTVPFIIEGDSPTISRLNPATVIAGSGEVTVNVIGGGFVRGSSVTANGQGLSTSFGSATSLDAVVPATLTQNIGRLTFKVTNPGNRESNEVVLNVTAPTPAITRIDPASANAGVASDVTISITGSGFIQGSTVQFNGSGIATEFGSSTSLSAVIPASSLTTPGTAQIRVSNPGDLLSNSVNFQILGRLEVTAVSPTSIVGGGTSNVTIGVSGVGFVNGSSVSFGGTTLATTFNSASSLSAVLTPALLATPGTFGISVSNPNGQTSNSVQFRIDAPIPPPTVNLQVPAVITPAGNGRVQVLLDAPAPVDLAGTLVLTFNNNSNNAPAGYIDPALVFAGTGSRTINFTIPRGSNAAALLADGAFSPGTVAGTIVVTMGSLTGGGQNLLPSPVPVRNIVVDRSVPVVVSGSVRITSVTGGFQVELNGISSVRDLVRITYNFTSGVNILEGSSVSVDVSQLFTTYFASDAGRAAGGAFRFTMPFTVSGGDAASVTAVTVVITNSVGASSAVSGGR